MPDRSKYPPRFDPGYFGILEPTRPQEEFLQTEDLSIDTPSYDTLLDLEEIRREYPTATHIYIENESNDGDRALKVTIERRTTSPNLNYTEQKQRYDAAMVEWRQKKVEWEALSLRWKEEVAAEQRTIEYLTYLKLKAKFEPEAPVTGGLVTG